jgi:hypothetical protein
MSARNSEATLSCLSFAVPPEAEASRAHQKKRVLLVLDGQRLTVELQMAALKLCVQWAHRLDILLVNSPKPATFLLGGLLLRLEHSGIDYRLISAEGELGNEATRHLQRNRGIELIVVDGPLEQCRQITRSGTDGRYCRIISLSEPEVQIFGKVTPV